jgi:hypothetical protein
LEIFQDLALVGQILGDLIRLYGYMSADVFKAALPVEEQESILASMRQVPPQGNVTKKAE